MGRTHQVEIRIEIYKPIRRSSTSPMQISYSRVSSIASIASIALAKAISISDKLNLCSLLPYASLDNIERVGDKMNRTEVERLKEKLKAEYERKLAAVLLVEQMLAEGDAASHDTE